MYGSSSYGACAPSPMLNSERQPEVAGALEWLNREVAETDDLLSRLQARLAVATQQRPENAQSAGEPPACYTAPLAISISVTAARVGDLRQRLRYQLDALELP